MERAIRNRQLRMEILPTNKQESYVPIMRKIVEKLVRLQIKGLHLGGDPSDLDDRQFYLSGLIGIDQDELSAGGRKKYFCRV